MLSHHASMMLVFNLDRETATEPATRMDRGKSVPKFRTKILHCLQTVRSSIFKRFEEITSGCLSGSNLVNSCVRLEIVVEVRRGYLVNFFINKSQDIKCKVSPSLRVLRDWKIGAEEAEHCSNLIQRRTFFCNRNSGLRYDSRVSSHAVMP